MRIEHKANCATLIGAAVERCDCGAKRKVIAHHDQSFYTSNIADGQFSLGNGNYRRKPLHSEG